MPRSLPERSCGVLLHPTSLPGPSGVGTLGEEAYRFVDFLTAAGQGIWQILPLGPVGEACSPYDSNSAFAGNALLIDERWLVDRGLLRMEEIDDELPSVDRADFVLARARKEPLLRLGFARFSERTDTELLTQFDEFRSRESAWLDDYAIFRAIEDSQNGLLWNQWPAALAARDSQAVAEIKSELTDEIRFHQFVQFLFDAQWHELRSYANAHGVRIMGDIPIYVSLDSADVWAHQHLFELDRHGKPLVVAGVPPDYFSSTGQLWGNPCYRWDELERADFRWWTERFRRTLELADIVRVDHFRAFQAGWQVAANEQTAINGRWVDGPGVTLFDCVERALGRLPIVVEDLGIITDDVDELRERLNLPGMKVLQFAFGGDNENPYLPHNFVPNCIVYTGTHDNDTTVGWYEHLNRESKEHVRQYLGCEPEEIGWALIRAAYASVAMSAIVPAQDLLGLGSEHRMNTPGTVEDDWLWRLLPNQLGQKTADRLRDLAMLYRRTSKSWLS